MEQELIFERKGGLGVITLNRPKSLNALTHAMCVAMHARLARWRVDDTVTAVVIGGAGERAFCAGGDIRALYESGKANVAEAVEYYRDEYRLNAAIKHFPKPFIAFVHGIAMGGGVGVSVHGSYRIVDTNTVFAMPETGIGLFPDVGGSFFLPRLPGEVGMYLALSGARLKSADVMYTGIGTHLIPMDDWGAVLERLAAADNPDGVLSEFAVAPGEPPLADHRAAIDRCFSQSSVETVLDALENSGGEWEQSCAATIRTRSPTSLKISFRGLREGAALSFDECMRMEFRMVNRVMTGHDFYEGVRATIIDRDYSPRWRPDTLSALTDADVDAYFAPIEQELPV